MNFCRFKEKCRAFYAIESPCKNKDGGECLYARFYRVDEEVRAEKERAFNEINIAEMLRLSAMFDIGLVARARVQISGERYEA